MGNPTDGNWGSSGDSPLARSTGVRSSRRATGPGFYNFLQDQLNRSGGLQPRKGTTTAFKGGDLDGMNQAQAEAHLADKYSGMSDADVAQYEPQTAALPHEVAQSSPASTYAGPTPSIPAPSTQQYSNSNHDSDFTPGGSFHQAATIAPGTNGLPAQRLANATPVVQPGAALPISPAGLVQMPTQPPYAAPAPVAPVAPVSTAATNPPPPVVGGTINGLPSDVAISSVKSRNNATDLASGNSPVPVIGSGASDTSASASKYVGPDVAPAPPGSDIDPATGKKRVTADMA